ncbi:hypothetical protein SAMN05444372_10230 [Flavobacterium micromati]|uniref:YhhN-like protein n=2 Tax=Flavobacterium micromati TaxID=229205 RepID=A0A1M5GJV5_9FLAO|nr:hypothetical protein [Flavobacterium micromati]SHG03997.1 hypothetical protein SAMN05444372_10230 [Flavobacterium micromati]
MDDFIIYSGYLLLLVNLILYSYSFFIKKKGISFYVVFLVFSFLLQMISEVLFLLKMNNLVLFNFFFIGQMVLLGLFYNKLMQTIRQKTFIICSIILGLMVLSVNFFLEPSQFFKFNLFQIALTSLLVVVFAMMHLYNILAGEKEFYYVTIGMIIYLLGSTVLFFVGNLTIGLSTEFKFFTWTLNAILVVLNQLFVLFEWKNSFYKKAVQTKLC